MYSSVGPLHMWGLRGACWWVEVASLVVSEGVKE
jgi:hypothetical protein